MSSYVLVEGAAQMCLCSAEVEMESGRWRPAVWFEKRADAGRARVPVIKHRLDEWFDHESAAVQAAEYYAGQNKDRESIGL